MLTGPIDERVIIAEIHARLVNHSIGEKKKTVGDAEVNDRMKRIHISSKAGLATTDNSAGPSTLAGTAPNPPKPSANVRPSRLKAGKESVTKPVKC